MQVLTVRNAEAFAAQPNKAAFLLAALSHQFRLFETERSEFAHKVKFSKNFDECHGIQSDLRVFFKRSIKITPWKPFYNEKNIINASKVVFN